MVHISHQVGTRGHAVVPILDNALQLWARKRNKTVNYVYKSQNIRTEMYSALRAEVEDPEEKPDEVTKVRGTAMNKVRRVE